MSKFAGKGAEFLIQNTEAIPAFVPVAQVQEIGEISVTAEEVEVTTLDAGDYREYIQGFKDPGECELTVIFDPAITAHDDSADGLIGLFASGEVRPCAIRWNSSAVGGATYATFSAFLRDQTYGALNPDDPQTVNSVFRITTPITISDTAPVVATAAPATPTAPARR